jgi:hypothetical protein
MHGHNNSNVTQQQKNAAAVRDKASEPSDRDSDAKNN